MVYRVLRLVWQDGVVGVMQLINKRFGPFDESDEDTLGKTEFLAARGLEASAHSVVAKNFQLSADSNGVLLAATFLSIAATHVQASSVPADSPQSLLSLVYVVAIAESRTAGGFGVANSSKKFRALMILLWNVLYSLRNQPRNRQKARPKLHSKAARLKGLQRRSQCRLWEALTKRRRRKRRRKRRKELTMTFEYQR